MFLRLCLRYTIYFILAAVALQVVFLILTLLSPGATKIGYEIAAALPAAYFLGRAERSAPVAMAAFVIATLTMALFAAQMLLTIKLSGINPGFDRYPATSFAILGGIVWGAALFLGGFAFRAGQGPRRA